MQCVRTALLFQTIDCALAMHRVVHTVRSRPSSVCGLVSAISHDVVPFDMNYRINFDVCMSLLCLYPYSLMQEILPLHVI
jgi:hypothetical protein